MQRYREIVYDLLTDLRQTFDDRQLTTYHIIYWVSIVGNKFLKQHIDNEVSRTQQTSGRYLTVYPEVDIQTVIENGINTIKGRKYFDLPSSVLDMDYERGVGYITYSEADPNNPPLFADVQFQRTTIGGANRIFASYETPSPENPYFYFVGSKVYLLGIENTNISKLEVGLYQTIDPRSVEVDLEQYCPLPDHLVTQMKYEIVNLGRFVLSMPQDKVNDGTDTVMVAPPKQTLSNEQQQ